MKVSVDVLSTRSVSRAIARIDAYIKKIERLAEELPKALAEYGVTKAQPRYDTAWYDVFTEASGGNFNNANDVEVYAEQRDDGWAVVAHGHDVCFIEFGAGVFFNGSGTYLGERPAEIDGIGEYGSGHGKQEKWAIRKGLWTYGTPASNALYLTAQDIRSVIEETARGILNSK